MLQLLQQGTHIPKGKLIEGSKILGLVFKFNLKLRTIVLSEQHLKMTLKAYPEATNMVIKKVYSVCVTRHSSIRSFLQHL